MNIYTPEGMAEAVAVQTAMLSQIAQGGRWVVPRSGSIYAIDHEGKQAKLLLCMRPEPKVTRVFEAMGWTLVTEDDKLQPLKANQQLALF